MARPTSPRLSRSLIAQAAIAMVDEGLELQIAPLAARLGVRPSSLYNHVAGRSGLIHAMREELAVAVREAPSDSPDWQIRLRSEILLAWATYSKHPRVLPLLMGVTVDEPDVLRHYRRIAESLIESGLADAEIPSTVAALDAFALGAALDALSPELVFSHGDSPDRLAEVLAKQPTGSERSRLIFEQGLTLLIGGISARVSAHL